MEMLLAMTDLVSEFAQRSKREELLYGKDKLEEVTHMTYVALGFRASDYILRD